jgi:hypothetical protein
VGSVLAQVAVYGLTAAAAAPVAAVVSALILGVSKRPVISAWAFVAGAAFLDVLFCVVVLGSGLADVSSDASRVDRRRSRCALRRHGDPRRLLDRDTRDAARRARANRIASSNLGRVLLAGIAVQLINIDAIAVFGGALKEIASAGLSTAGVVFATAFGLAIMLSVYYAPAVIYSLFPSRASDWLGRMSEWILANSRMLEIVVGIGFGVYFLLKGLVVLV